LGPGGAISRRLFRFEAVEACVEAGVYERAPVPGQRYVAFTDPSGGSADSFTLAIAHRQRDGRAVVDAIRERTPPFSPEAVVTEFAVVLRSYRCASVSGDKYAGEFPRELFRKCGAVYKPSERSKSELYVELLPLINSRRVDLLDDRKAIAQLVGLERRTSRVGKDSIDHAPGGRDDRINAVAGAVVTATLRPPMKNQPRNGRCGGAAGPEPYPVRLWWGLVMAASCLRSPGSAALSLRRHIPRLLSRRRRLPLSRYRALSARRARCCSVRS
jgi:hypothetical protein